MIKRLLESDASQFERMLLEAGQSELPTEQLERKMMAPLGLGLVTATSAAEAVTEAGHQQTLAPGQGNGATPSTSTGSDALAHASHPGRWTVAAIAGGAALGGLITFFAMQSSERAIDLTSLTQSSKQVAAEAEPSFEQNPENEMQVAPELLEMPADSDRGQQVVKAGSAQRQVKKSAPQSTLREEMRLLDAVRTAVQSKDSKRALALLSSYEQKFSEGILKDEATVLRVSALQMAGENNQAQAVSDKFLRDNPQSAHKNRLDAESP